MKSENRPELIGPPANRWEPIGNGYWWRKPECNKRSCRLNGFSYDLNGNLTNVVSRRAGIFRNCPLEHYRCVELKSELVEAGYATQRDANYFAMKVMREYPQIVKAMVYRFPIVMMDEAQDTSDVEMKAVELLIDNGLKEVMLIGDPEQAIFEWRDAKPELLEGKYEEWEANSLTLEENWRSSQKICDFFSKMSGFEEPAEAVNDDVRGFEAAPEIWGYDEAEVSKTVGRFLEVCEDSGMRPETDDIGILARSAKVVRGIQGRREQGATSGPWRNDITEAVCHSRFLFDSKDFRKAFYHLEKGICRKILNLDYCAAEDLEKLITDYGFVKWRKSVYKLVGCLPKTDCALGEWIAEAKGRLGDDNLVKGDEIGIIGRGRYAGVYPGLRFEEVFCEEAPESSEDAHRVGTVHSVKGETLDAVLVVLKKEAGDARKYTNVLGEETIRNEELRIVYVAITRPRKFLVIAVPLSEKTAWEAKFFGSDDASQE
jgi:hypothetical protein